MNEEEKALLKKTYDLAKENNKILSKMRKKANFASMWHALKWIAIIAFTIYSYILIQPFIDQAKEVYVGVKETTETVKGLKDQSSEGIDKIFNFFGKE